MLALGLAGVSPAQTDSVATATMPTEAATTIDAQTNAVAPGLQVTRIHSDWAEGSPVSRTAAYFGNVTVDDPQMKLRSEYLLAKKLPRTVGKYESLTTRTNVVIDFFESDGKKHHVTGDQAVYTCDVSSGHTNEVVVVTGNPVWIAPDGTVTKGTALSWDAITRKMTGQDVISTIPVHSTNRGDIFQSPSHTRTNQPAATTTAH